MPYHLDDTIIAIASASGGAARGMVRLSGPDVKQVLSGIFTTSDPSWHSSGGRARIISGRIALDAHAARSLACDVYWWPTERSYTREPVAEIHTLGSPPLLSAVVKRACEHGARFAEPGEFTLRAFLAGRLDLTQAEAVLGVIDARGNHDLHAALDQLAGGLARPLAAARELLVDLLSHLEAGLDFVEEDIEFISSAELARQLAGVAAAVDAASEQLATRFTADDAVRVALVGWPNVGKSSLFNALSTGSSLALVSSESGTTRDYLAAAIELGGLPAVLVDTAGVEADSLAPDAASISAAAQRFAAEQSLRADVRLLCLDATRSLNNWERDQLAVDGGPRLIVWTKCDRAQPPPVAGTIETSATNGLGLSQLRRALEQVCRQVWNPAESAVVGTAERCHDSLQLASQAIDRARALCACGEGEELVAAELHLAIDELGRVAGVVYTDDILDRIFSRFCIGK